MKVEWLTKVVPDHIRHGGVLSFCRRNSGYVPAKVRFEGLDFDIEAFYTFDPCLRPQFGMGIPREHIDRNKEFTDALVEFLQKLREAELKVFWEEHKPSAIIYSRKVTPKEMAVNFPRVNEMGGQIYMVRFNVKTLPDIVGVHIPVMKSYDLLWPTDTDPGSALHLFRARVLGEQSSS